MYIIKQPLFAVACLLLLAGCGGGGGSSGGGATPTAGTPTTGNPPATSGDGSSGGGSTPTAGTPTTGNPPATSGDDSSGGGSTPTPIVFPRADPCISAATCPNTDDAGYAARKSAAAAFSEYGGDYLVHGRGENEMVINERFVTKHWLGQINADAAYARGATGDGETIAVFEEGIRETHREFSGKAVGIETVPRDRGVGYDPTDDDKFYGTAVAGLAVANRDSAFDDNEFNMHGVAFDAGLHFTQIEFGGGLALLVNLKLFTVEDDADNAMFLDSLLETAYDGGARIANLGFTASGSISYFIEQYGEPLLRERYRQFASVSAQPDRSAADKMIIVWAAGDEGDATLAGGSSPDFSSPGVFAGLGVVFPELRGHVITVVALDEDGGIADYSNRCGIAKAFCLAAPGSNLVSAGSFGDDGYVIDYSTHFAAPLVSGSLALLRQHFRGQLGNTELVARLLATANRAGRYSNSDIYGHGLVDLDAATRPFGTTTVLGTPIAQNAITPSAPFGDALSRAFNGQSIAGFDSLNAPFQYNLGGFVNAPTASLLAPLQQLHSAMPSRKRGYDGGLSAAGAFAFNGAFSDAGAFDGAPINIMAASPASHLHLANDGLNLGLARRNGLLLSAFAGRSRNGERGDTPRVAGLTFAWEDGGNLAIGKTQLAFGGGYLYESDEVLASTGEGAFADLSSQSIFFAAGARRQLHKWQVNAGVEAGVAMSDGNHLFDDVEPLLTSSFSLGAARGFGKRNQLHLKIAQPLRVEHGDATVTLPAGRTPSGDIVYSTITPSLRPSGRQLDATATWQRKLPAGYLPAGYLTVTSRLSHQPNHTADADVSIATLASYRLEF